MSRDVALRRMRRVEEEKLTDSLRLLEEELSSRLCTSFELPAKIAGVRADLRKLQLRNVEKQLLGLNQRYYEKGEKADRLLVYKLRRQR